jgi:Ca2+/H+ antiporter
MTTPAPLPPEPTPQKSGYAVGHIFLWTFVALALVGLALLWGYIDTENTLKIITTALTIATLLAIVIMALSRRPE